MHSHIFSYVSIQSDLKSRQTHWFDSILIRSHPFYESVSSLYVTTKMNWTHIYSLSKSSYFKGKASLIWRSTYPSHSHTFTIHASNATKWLYMFAFSWSGAGLLTIELNIDRFASPSLVDNVGRYSANNFIIHFVCIPIEWRMWDTNSWRPSQNKRKLYYYYLTFSLPLTTLLASCCSAFQSPATQPHIAILANTSEPNVTST